MTRRDDMLEDVARRCAGGHVLFAARALARHYDEAVRSAGLTITQFTLLAVIARAEPDSIARIAQLLSMDRTSVSRNLSLLERDGLVRREAAAPPKGRAVRITEEGAAKLEAAYPLWQAAQRDIERRFDPDRYGDVLRDLKTLGGA